MGDKESSTLQSYLDSASGAAKSMVGSITGDREQQVAGADQRDEAKAKDELSHATAKVGSYTASGSGAVTKDDPNRSEGSWNQTLGSAKESLGNLVGHEGLRQSGAEQNQQGKAQEAQGQLNDLTSGVANRVQGAVGGAMAGFTGDRQAQKEYQDQHDTGKTQQRGAEADIQKQSGQ